MAAGAVLVREAGGYVADVNGQPEFMETGDIVAGNEAMQKEVVALLKKAQAG